MSRRVVVTGIGLLTPLGDDPRAIHRALCAGDGALRELTEIDSIGLAPPTVGAPLAGFDAANYLGRRGLRGMDRSSRLTATAAALALAAAGLRGDGGDGEESGDDETGLVLGTMLSGVRTTSRFDRRAVTAGPGYAKPMDFANTVINAAAGQAAIRLALRGLNATVSSGYASGLQAIGHATDLIRAGRARRLLAGGMDELSWESLVSFRAAGLLAGNGNGNGNGALLPTPCDRRRNGIALGEAAAFLLLEDADAAGERGAAPLAEVLGHGSAFDPAYRRRGEVSGEALRRAVDSALATGAVEPRRLAALSVSASGSPEGDLAEARGLAGALGSRVGEVPVTAVKGALGESLGAAGAVAAALLVVALRAGRLPGIHRLAAADEALPYSAPTARPRRLAGRHGLVTSRGADGKSAALVLAAADAAGERS